MRGTLTTEVWETQNQTWLEVQPHAARTATSSATRAQFFEWVKFRSHLSRGVTVGTMLQDEALHFMRLGTFLERADNTARLLDVKFHALAQRVLRHRQPRKDQEYDFYHWSAILRIGLGLRGLPQGLPRRDQARARGRAADPARRHAALAARLHERGGEQPDAWWPTTQSAETQRRAGKLRADLQYGHIDEILATGLHAYLTQFLDRVNELGCRISRDFLVPVAA